jgi:hypothetical protein
VEVNLEMERVGSRTSRVRRLTANGRLRATNWVIAVELSEDGADYSVVEDHGAPAADPLAQLASDAMLLRAHGPLTVKSYMTMTGVPRSTAYRRLVALRNEGLAVVSKSELTSGGRPGDVFTAVEPRAVDGEHEAA